MRVGADAPSLAPAERGAYVLLLRLDRQVPTKEHALAPGWYAYAGSANGPGGIRARLARHMRAGKKTHWHVDSLTGVSGGITALALPGGSECTIVRALEGTGRFAHPAPGFGSSDCRNCTSHLLAWRG